jgi:hypothetical protein
MGWSQPVLFLSWSYDYTVFPAAPYGYANPSISPRTVLIPPGLTIPIPALARRCAAISAGESIASYRRPAPRHTLAQLLENPRQA